LKHFTIRGSWGPLDQYFLVFMCGPSCYLPISCHLRLKPLRFSYYNKVKLAIANFQAFHNWQNYNILYSSENSESPCGMNFFADYHFLDQASQSKKVLTKIWHQVGSLSLHTANIFLLRLLFYCDCCPNAGQPVYRCWTSVTEETRKKIDLKVIGNF
jgi:hypothetical protein